MQLLFLLILLLLLFLLLRVSLKTGAKDVNFMLNWGGSKDNRSTKSHALAQSTWAGSSRQIQIADNGPVVGKAAVLNAKKIAMLKESEQFGLQSNDKLDAKDGQIKQTEGKTFYLSSDGQTWIDSEYKNEKVEEISFASNRYFELAKNSNKLSAYLAVGKQVIFVYQGHAYKITSK